MDVCVHSCIYPLAVWQMSVRRIVITLRGSQGLHDEKRWGESWLSNGEKRQRGINKLRRTGMRAESSQLEKVVLFMFFFLNK